MFKASVILVLVALLAVCFSQNMAGGYKQINEDGLLELQNDETFQTALQMARDEYTGTHNQNLGELTEVSHQIVSGVNYKMVFDSPSGLVQIIIYCQPWTSTYEVLEMKPFVEQE